MHSHRRTPKPVILLTLVLAVTALVAGCARSTDDSTAGGRIPAFTIGTTTVVQSLDPALAYNKVLSTPMFQGLLALDDSNGIEPLLAESYSQPQPNVYEFVLRRDVKFWNGNTMTSADVVASLNYYADPATGKGVASQYAGVADIAATDDHTVTITLERPDVSFLQTLAWAGTIFEKEHYEQNASTFGAPGTLLQATGPFRVISFDPNTGIEFAASQNYWGGPVDIDTLSVKYFKNDTSAALAFRTGEIDVAFPTEADAFAPARGRSCAVHRPTRWVCSEST
ncbi:ABC transporter substrate-binding protein [Gordonia hongkongensis]|uniref:ABC transporter substrate-binding protein n=1 Tax=Gordonia hongkongensis TaxID=1701090 RepID=UPI003EBCA2D2